MKELEVGAFEAKNRLSELLAMVEKGQVVHITRRGKRIAILGPVDRGDRTSRSGAARAFIDEIRAFRAAAKPGPEPLRRLIEEGRR